MIGKRIRDLRKENKLTQDELGKVLNVGKSTISQYENNINTPDNYMLSSIADYFHVSVDWLLGRTNNRDYFSSDKDTSSVDNSITKAYHNLDIDGLPEEAIQQVEEYIEFIKKKYNPDGSLKKKNNK